MNQEISHLKLTLFNFKAQLNFFYIVDWAGEGYTLSVFCHWGNFPLLPT